MGKLDSSIPIFNHILAKMAMALVTQKWDLPTVVTVHGITGSVVAKPDAGLSTIHGMAGSVIT